MGKQRQKTKAAAKENGLKLSKFIRQNETRLDRRMSAHELRAYTRSC